MKPACGFRRPWLHLYEGAMHQQGSHAVDYYRADVAMGTLFEVFLRGDEEAHLEAVAVAVLEEISRLDATLSRFDPRSEIARINREAGQKQVRVEREVFALIERCEQARQLTAGYFDITAMTGGGLQLDAEHCALHFMQPGVEIDLGGVGKGYALDRGAELLIRFGVRAGLLQGGTSSVRVIGTLANGHGWPLVVRHPQAPDQAPIVELKLMEGGFSCSAARHPEQVQSDIVNPLSGKLLDGHAACIVLANNATEAEIFSTALLAMGHSQAVHYLANDVAPHLQVGWFDNARGFEWLTRA
jgi:FAD:protein FMN transferase